MSDERPLRRVTINVTDYWTGEKDEHENPILDRAIVEAMNEAGRQGSKVYLPAGTYRLRGSAPEWEEDA